MEAASGFGGVQAGRAGRLYDYTPRGGRAQGIFSLRPGRSALLAGGPWGRVLRKGGAAMRPFPYTGETIPYTELAAAEPGSPLAVEWEFYRREVGRLLAEGNEGRFVLIKGEAVIGLFDTWE